MGIDHGGGHAWYGRAIETFAGYWDDEVETARVIPVLRLRPSGGG